MFNSQSAPKVSIVPNKTTNMLVTAYTSNPEFGYIQLESSTMEFQGGWMRQAKRSCLLRAETELLKAFVDAHKKNLQVPGRIVVREYAENECPEPVLKRFVNQKMDYEEAVDQFLKRAGSDGPVLMTGDSRILRFSFYDPSGKEEDLFVQHDNAGDGSSARVSSVVKSEETPATPAPENTEAPETPVEDAVPAGEVADAVPAGAVAAEAALPGDDGAPF